MHIINNLFIICHCFLLQKLRFVNLQELKTCFGDYCLGDTEDSSISNPYESFPSSNELNRFPNHRSTFKHNIKQEISGNFITNSNLHGDLPFVEHKDEIEEYENGNEFTKSIETDNVAFERNEEESEEQIEDTVDYDEDYKSHYPRLHFPELSFDSIREEQDDNQPYFRIPSLCYQPLHLENCSDPRVTDNFWFYNLCHNKCMLYAADICDNNLNRFTSLEKCEVICRQPIAKMGIHFLTRKQRQTCRS